MLLSSNILFGGKKIPIILFAFLVYLIIPTESRTIRLIPLLLLSISCSIKKSFWTKNRKKYCLGCIPLIIFSSFVHGIFPAKDLFIILFMLVSLQYMGEQYSIRHSNYVYLFFTHIIIPISIISYFVKGGVTYIPEDMTINIFGYDSTKHDTAIIGYLLFVASGYNIYYNHSSKKKNIFYFFLSIYITFFSGSRSCLLALIATILLYLINLRQIRVWISTVFFICIIFLSYSLEELKQYSFLIEENSIIRKIAKVENFNQHGVTSGRAWLWKYHWSKFIESNYIGSGREFTDFRVGDYVPTTNEIAPAGGESPYTNYLACYGLLGIMLLIFFFFLFYHALTRKNIIGTCIIFCAIYNTMLGCNLTDPTHPVTFLAYLLYFSSFKPTLL